MARPLAGRSLFRPDGSALRALVVDDEARLAEVLTSMLAVRDDGPGIAQDVLPRVFSRFGRGDSGRSRTGAHTGLGLSIADSIVRAHGGTIAVHSRPGHTQFTVALPVAAQIAAPR